MENLITKILNETNHSIESITEIHGMEPEELTSHDYKNDKIVQNKLEELSKFLDGYI